MSDALDRARLEAGQFLINLAHELSRASRRRYEEAVAVQHALLNEGAKIVAESIERAGSEVHLGAEAISKMGQAHSVDGIKTAMQECTVHRLNMARADVLRWIEHGEGLVENIKARRSALLEQK